MFLSEWREFPSAPCLAGKKKLDDSARLDVVEIARVPDMLPSLFPSTVGLRTYQHPGNISTLFENTQKTVDIVHITKCMHIYTYIYIYCFSLFRSGARGGAVGWRTALQAGRSRVRFPMVPSRRTMVLGSTQPLTEMSTRNISWG